MGNNKELELKQALQEMQKTKFKGDILYECSFKIGQTIGSDGEDIYCVVNENNEQVYRLKNLRQGEFLISFFKSGV